MPGIDECLRETMVLPGARGAAVVDWTSGLALGTVGASPVGDHERTAVETAELARMAAEQPSFNAAGVDGAGADGAGADAAGADGASAQGETLPALEDAAQDIIVSTRVGYHLLRFVETEIDSSVFLHLWLDGHEGNLAMARIRLRELAERLVLE